jgi:DNA-binding NtrC family response regulator
MKFNKNYTLFIVDDDPIYSEFITTILNQAGYKGISTFETESKVMDNLYQAPDVIFLDYFLENTNGLDVLRKIKATNPDIHVVFLSSQEKIEIAVNSLKFGALDYIIKNDEAKRRIISSMNRIKNLDSKKKNLLSKLKENFSIFNLLF